MTLVSLTQTKVRELLDYNPITGEFVWKVNRGKVAIGEIAGYVNPGGYVAIGIDGYPHLAHRLVWLYVYGRWPKEQIDHINRNRKDNSFANLREVSNKQNSHNTRLVGKYNTSIERRLNMAKAVKENCTCKYIALGMPMRQTGCVVHTQEKYACGECGCDDYRPIGPPIPYKTGWIWKACSCGHAAQEHN